MGFLSLQGRILRSSWPVIFAVGLLVVLPVGGCQRKDRGGARTDAQQPDSPQDDNSGEIATRLGLRAHTEAAATEKLPRFSYEVRYRHGKVDSMRAVDRSLDLLMQGLTAPVLEKDWFGWYETRFSWDEQQFIYELRPGETVLNYHFLFWKANDAWERLEANDKSSVNFVRGPGPKAFWKRLQLFDYSYLRLTPHRSWWGQSAHVGSSLTMSSVPPEKASWSLLRPEAFGGEMCDVVDSAQRRLRLWIGRESGRVRGALTYYVDVESTGEMGLYKSAAIQRIAGKKFKMEKEYDDWFHNASDDQLIQLDLVVSELYRQAVPADIQPNELIQFDDYREVATGVWLPFREIRTFPHASEAVQGKLQFIRTELNVEEVHTDLSLTERYSQLLPKEGDPVQDQRFAVPVPYEFRADRNDDEIRQTANAKNQKILKGQEILKGHIQPIEELVGKPAPVLPGAGWIGQRPDLVGKPHLLHFWATWCGPCRNDLPRLKTLAESGVIIVGLHPSGTSAEEVEAFIRNEKVGDPTFLSSEENTVVSSQKIGDYPAGVYPYYIVVNAQGQVAGHGSLSEILNKFDMDALIAPRKATTD